LAPVKRALAVFGLVITAVAGVLVVQQTTRNRRYLQLLESGQQALDSGNSYLAIEAFSGALALRPQSMVAYYHRGEAYRSQSRADSRFPRGAPACPGRGTAAHRARRPE